MLDNGVTLGIGTSSPDESYLLDVAGGIHATDLTVTNPITGSVTGNAGTVTNGLHSTGSYSDPCWLTSLAGNKISGDVPGNAAGFTGTLAGDITGGMSGLTGITAGTGLIATGNKNVGVAGHDRRERSCQELLQVRAVSVRPVNPSGRG